MSFVFDEVGTFIRCEQIRNELVEFGSGFVARKIGGFELDQFFRDLNETRRCVENPDPDCQPGSRACLLESSRF